MYVYVLHILYNYASHSERYNTSQKLQTAHNVSRKTSGHKLFACFATESSRCVHEVPDDREEFLKDELLHEVYEGGCEEGFVRVNLCELLHESS